MRKTKAMKDATPTKKRKRPVAIDRQNPASTDVQLMIESLKKRKPRGK